jgi:hypothetical protein
MKKKTKKLVLAKETVRDLSAIDLREAAGGTTWQATCAGCTDDSRYLPREPATHTCHC